MDYYQFSVEDFVADASFIRWVKVNDEQSKAFWEQWQKEHPEKSAEIKEARALVAIMYTSVSQQNSHPTPTELAESKKLILERTDNHQPLVPSKIKHTLSRYQLIAAVALLVIISSLALWWYQSNFNQTTYRTAYGEMKTITLPDQSTVTLNGNSVLETNSHWSEGEPRKVWLSGEAYFKVAHQSDSNRFVVHTTVVDIEVFGTHFNVNHRRREAEVILAEGSVKISTTSSQSASAPKFMQPGEMVRLHDGILKLSKVDIEKNTAWRKNRLYFEKESLAEIAQRLEDSYGLKIKFSAPQLSQLTFTGSSPANDLSMLFIALSEALEVEVNRNKSTVLIQNKQP